MGRHTNTLAAGRKAVEKLGRVYGAHQDQVGETSAGEGDANFAPTPADKRRITVARAWIRANQLRGRYLDPALFADPAWSILLDLYVNRLLRRKVSVSSACIAAEVPPTTALRWLKTLTDAQWLCRSQDPADHRRVFITMPDDVSISMDALMDAATDSDRKLGLERMHVIQ